MARAKGRTVSGAREAILSAIERSRGSRVPRPRYRAPAPAVNDLSSLFAAKASAEGAQVEAIASPQDAPAAIASALDGANAPPRLHLPVNSPLRALPWDRAPGLAVLDAAPGADDAALAAADYAIAETGTLVFFAARERPASWHFLPGREFVLLSRAQILPALEDVLVLALAQGMPSTLNLVTGPSRTGDIEQTMEMGAHGPRHLHILLCD